MFELPEILTLARQINETLTGKIIQKGSLGNSPHKFVWYNQTHADFEELTRGKQIGVAAAKGRWLLVPFDPGYTLVLGELGGKVRYHPEGTPLPEKYHLCIAFNDGSFLTATTQMWGAYELYAAGMEQERQYIKDMKTTPVDIGFTFDYFSDLIDALILGEKRSVKSLLTQDQLIPGLGNAIAQDILFNAGLHPRHPLAELDRNQRRQLFEAIIKTVNEAIVRGGRNDEEDLFGNSGQYLRLMDKKAVGRPCPACGGLVVKIQYLGGSCYYCPRCQL
jgi:formamidopyrimidine-DNA glycosylase